MGRRLRCNESACLGWCHQKPLPDVIAGNGKIYLAIEVKSTSQERIYIDSGKIDALLEFSEIFGAQPYVGAKFIREKWRFVRIEHLHKTKQENYRLDKELAFKKGIELDELLGKSKQVKFD